MSTYRVTNRVLLFIFYPLLSFYSCSESLLLYSLMLQVFFVSFLVKIFFKIFQVYTCAFMPGCRFFSNIAYTVSRLIPVTNEYIVYYM